MSRRDGGPEPGIVPEGVSACWRKNTSRLEAAELANLLRALRKVAGHLGDNAGRIEYAGMSTAGDGGILIEIDPLMGRYPVPAEKVDGLVGLVVHEALRRMEWSDHVWKLLEPVMEKLTSRSMVVFQKLVRTGEWVYLDLRADQGVFGLYTRVSRSRTIDAERLRFSGTRGPSVDELMIWWWESAFLTEGFSDPPPDGKFCPGVMEGLAALGRGLKKASRDSGGVIRRCEIRAGLYRKTWENLQTDLLSLNIIDKHLCRHAYEKDPAKDGNRKSGQAAASVGKLKPALFQDISRRLSVDAVDITPLIRSVAGHDNETVAPMSRWDFQMEAHPVLDRKMIGRLKSLFARFADREAVINRGLQSGRIDGRRLHRAAVDGWCFKAVDRIPNPDWCVGLLVDASGSMRGNKWRMVENTIAAIHRALSGYRNRLFAWAYFEVSGICMISRLISGNRLLSVPPAGQTASGQAIIAAADMMPENIKRNLIIHITDGESNFGCDVSWGLEFCRLRNIRLITLGCGYKDRPAMERQYGRSIQFIDYFEQLPLAMENLFKWAFIYGRYQKCAERKPPCQIPFSSGKSPDSWGP